MNTAQARKLGYEIERGSYYGTTDDRADRWYIQHKDEPIRRFKGYITRGAALSALAEHVKFQELYITKPSA